jgi:hypothetical protein
MLVEPGDGSVDNKCGRKTADIFTELYTTSCFIPDSFLKLA